MPAVDSPLPLAERICNGVVITATLVPVAVAGSNLALWCIPALQFIAGWPGMMVMRVNTCVAILSAAFSLLLWHLAKSRGPACWQRWMAPFCGAVAAAIGCLTSLEYLMHSDLGIDTLLGPATFPQDHANAFVSAPGRMSLNASLSLFFLGLALWGLDWKVRIFNFRGIFTAPILAVTSALPAFFALVGYVSGTGNFTGLLKSTNILLHTALSLMLVALGVMAIRNDRHPVRRILSQSAGGMLLRWMLPGSTASLIILAWMVGRGRGSGLIAPGEGRALMLFGGLILFYTLIIAVSRAVDDEETKARLAKSALRDEEQRSQSILKTSLDGVLLMDVEGRIVDWNLAAEQIFGWKREEMLGRVLADYIIPERMRASHTHALQTYLETGVGPILGQRLELPALRRDGSEFPAELSINAVVDAVPPMFVGFIRDITARQKANQALREAKDEAEKASQAKDDFLAALSHELRTPLTPVLLSSSVMSKDMRLPEDVRHALGMIERHVSLEARLIDDLLDLTRISRGKLLLRTELCDVHSLIHHAWEIIKDDAKSKNLDVQIDLQASHSRLAGDPARIQQVFWNLLKNAVKFTPPAGSIQLTSHHDAATMTLVVEVKDTGIGFEPSLAQQLFLPFEQEKMEVQFGGLGLGLAIARAIVELHGGSIAASSAGPGKGALFTVALPCEAATQKDAIASVKKREIQQPSGQFFHILLVEDHEPTRQVLARLLNRAGHQVTAVGSIAEALVAAELESTRLDMLVSDVGLPDGSGMDLMRNLRSREITLTGIALSGYGMEEDLQRTRDAGFARHLVKPVKFDQLLQAINELHTSGEMQNPI
ncbi:hybrid sensor histidine kinase/response regulator [Prosthecobacter fusiformis]|uniref:hybrid sensor histidine kinase/response regulator n=1 Tax=Prosthecobacter fusiformis TaxID=48464 RepID=UPI001061A6E1|nr:PAS domain-containing hybrid sensor histidine kinase/response regulator [Prosthecobacter fusiformis]